MKRSIVFLLADDVLALTSNAESFQLALALHSCCVTEDATTKEGIPAGIAVAAVENGTMRGQESSRGGSPTSRPS